MHIWTYDAYIHDPWPWCMCVWCIVSVILDPDDCTYDAHICDAHIYDSEPWSWCMHVSMMQQILLRTDGRTDEQADSRSWISDQIWERPTRPPQFKIVKCGRGCTLQTLTNVLNFIYSSDIFNNYCFFFKYPHFICLKIRVAACSFFSLSILNFPTISYLEAEHSPEPPQFVAWG